MKHWAIKFSDGSLGAPTIRERAYAMHRDLDPERKPLCSVVCLLEVPDDQTETLRPLATDFAGNALECAPMCNALVCTGTTVSGGLVPHSDFCPLSKAEARSAPPSDLYWPPCRRCGLVRDAHRGCGSYCAPLEEPDPFGIVSGRAEQVTLLEHDWELTHGTNLSLMLCKRCKSVKSHAALAKGCPSPEFSLEAMGRPLPAGLELDDARETEIEALAKDITADDLDQLGKTLEQRDRERNRELGRMVGKGRGE